MSDDPQTVDSGDVSIPSAIKATVVDWIVNTPPGGLYTGLATLLPIVAGAWALYVLGPTGWLDKYGTDYRAWALALAGALLAFKGVGKVVVHLTEKAKAKAAKAAQTVSVHTETTTEQKTEPANTGGQ